VWAWTELKALNGMGFGQGTLLLVEGAAHRLAQSLKACARRGHGGGRSTKTSIEDLACWLCPTPMPPTSPTTCGWPSAGSLGACSSSRPAFPDRGDEPAEAGGGRGGGGVRERH